MLKKSTAPILTLILSILLLTAACSGKMDKGKSHNYELASSSILPIDMQSAPDVVLSAYRFAVANPEILSDLPCYCGCGGMEHTSNFSCYVSRENEDGSLDFDDHALGCSICVDITVDAMRMLDEGKTVPEIRSYIDQTYSAFGPSNIQE